MAALIDALLPARRRADSMTMSDWVGLWGLDNLGSFLQTTMQREQEASDGTFAGLVAATYLRNPIVFACLALRARLFGEARFQFQQMRGGRPGALFGTPDLLRLERPEPGKTTRDLLSSAILDADLGGGGFLLGRTNAIRRLRPDWTVIAYGSKRRDSELGAWDPDAEAIGYGFWPGGLNSGEEVQTFLPDEIAHFAPTKDPLARNRGISLLTAGLREVLADNGATTHKLAFFNNAATPNLALKFPISMSKESADEWIELFEQQHKGASKAYRTIYLGAGIEPMTVGLDFEKMRYSEIQGKAETRIAALTGMHPVVAALSEGLSGSSLNAGNFGSAARLVADATLRPLWGDIAGSLESIIPPPGGTRLWYDDRDIAFLREDVKDQAEITQLNGQTIGQYIRDGFTPASAIAAVLANDPSLLVHTGLTSVQLQPPLGEPTAPAAFFQVPATAPVGRLPSDVTTYRAVRAFTPLGRLESVGPVAALAEVEADHPLVVDYPSLFEPVRASGPALIVSRSVVVAKRDELRRLGLPSGRESIAKALDVSPATVRRRLAGD